MDLLTVLLQKEINMFFNISTHTADHRFPNNYQIRNLWVNCDNGWQRTNNTFYKGYSDNYCKIIVDESGAKIEHSIPRSFPLYYQDGQITNLESTANQAWADDSVAIDHLGVVTLSKNPINLNLDDIPLTITQAQDQIVQLLNKKLTQVPANLKLFCSGGLDTLLLYAMLKGRHPFELVQHEYYQQDTFTKVNQQILSKFWAYNQIHHWTNPTWLATGSHGDEYFLRGPAVIAMLTAWHNINFGKLLADNPGCYHYHHFYKYTELWTDSWANRNQLQEQYPTIELLNRQILNILVNDHQHWHLGNTLTWTPYKDIEIVKILLRCPITELVTQFLDGHITKSLIEYYSPGSLAFLSQYKNHGNRENLSKMIA